MPQKRFLRVVGREADAMTGDISARRGALPIKSTPPDHSEMVNGFELFKGVAGDTLKKKPRRWGQSTGANRGIRKDRQLHLEPAS